MKMSKRFYATHAPAQANTEFLKATKQAAIEDATTKIQAGVNFDTYYIVKVIAKVSKEVPVTVEEVS